MKLSLVHFEQPRTHNDGAIHGRIAASATCELEYVDGAIVVKKGAHPPRWYAVGPRDWWEPAVEKPAVEEPTVEPTVENIPIAPAGAGAVSESDQASKDVAPTILEPAPQPFFGKRKKR